MGFLYSCLTHRSPPFPPSLHSIEANEFKPPAHAFFERSSLTAVALKNNSHSGNDCSN